MIRCEKITMWYKTWNTYTSIYQELDWSVKNWEFHAIMWRSWSGKSTLLQLIAGILRPSMWHINVLWKDITAMDDTHVTTRRSQNISFIFQQFLLLPHLTVTENIELPIALHNLPRNFDTNHILEMIWLQWKQDRYPNELSGGEQQRVGIARAFIAKTPILLADEPTWNLDDDNARTVLSLMQELHKETKNTMIMITHDQMAAWYADTVSRVVDKKIIPYILP